MRGESALGLCMVSKQQHRHGAMVLHVPAHGAQQHHHRKGALIPQGPDHGATQFDVDFTQRDLTGVEALIDELLMGGTGEGADKLSPWAFVHRSGTGVIPHHVVVGGRVLINRNAVVRGLGQLDQIPHTHRDAVRDHLLDHVRTWGEAA